MSPSESKQQKKALSELEREVMQVVWSRGPSTADDIRRQLATAGRDLKDSTVRTVLRRLEDKSFVGHETEGRTYVYQPLVRSRGAAALAVRQIVDRFCGGSVEELLMGLVDDEVVSRAELRRLAEMISRDEAKGETP